MLIEWDTPKKLVCVSPTLEFELKKIKQVLVWILGIFFYIRCCYGLFLLENRNKGHTNTQGSDTMFLLKIHHGPKAALQRSALPDRKNVSIHYATLYESQQPPGAPAGSQEETGDSLGEKGRSAVPTSHLGTRTHCEGVIASEVSQKDKCRVAALARGI